MKIILHGATDCGSSNYGDFLYGKIIYDFLTERYPGASVSFYNPSDYFQKYIDEPVHSTIKGKLSSSDLAVYIPGGYFGEGHNASWKETLVQFMRFIPFGMQAIALKKPIAIVGVGAGPNNSRFFRNAIKFIVERSRSVSVRDQESYDALKKFTDKDIICSADTIIAFDIRKYDASESMWCKEFFSQPGSKTLLVHFNHSEMAAKKFGEAANAFIRDHKEYRIVVSSDQRLESEPKMLETFERAFGSSQYTHYTYENPYEFGCLISNIDLVLTCKLHVGVTAAVKGKAVLAAAVHPEKTERFYRQIGAPENFMNLHTSTSIEIARQLDRIEGHSIVIGQEQLSIAEKSLIELDAFVKKEMPVREEK